MGNFSDEELKKWLTEEYNKEIDEMEKIMFPDGNIPEDGETEEEARAAYARLVERLKADGIYEEENDSEKADNHRKINEKTEEPEKVKIVYLPAKPEKRNRLARVAAVMLVCAAGVFAASMTSQANRSYFIDSVKLWTGNDTKIVVGNASKNDSSKMEEDEEGAITDISEQLKINVPRFVYRPNTFEFKDYEVDKNLKFGLMEYQYKNTIVTLYVDQNSDAQNSSAIGLDGREIKKIEFSDDDIVITLMEVEDKKDQDRNYVAYWKQEAVYYQISGKMEENEFEKLIKNIRF
mgnify:CR=1 FL=1